MECSHRTCRQCGIDLSGYWPSKHDLCIRCAEKRIDELEAAAPDPALVKVNEAALIVCHRIAQTGADSPEVDAAHKQWAVAWVAWHGARARAELAQGRKET